MQSLPSLKTQLIKDPRMMSQPEFKLFQGQTFYRDGDAENSEPFLDTGGLSNTRITYPKVKLNIEH